MTISSLYFQLMNVPGATRASPAKAQRFSMLAPHFAPSSASVSPVAPTSNVPRPATGVGTSGILLLMWIFR